ncbi:MAG: thioredoxin-disulfide reductase [Deltaproteobacteria bacterium RBG_16_54_11]|nr:MAG: thioredoxin-disulfide reductase [Deltaproteobacteria bacterium RBG_16_54_11]
MDDYHVIIIGGGAAGLTAGLYASRAQLKTILLESMIPSGQAYMTERIENYPGFPDGIAGRELIERFTQQATRFGLEIQQFTAVDRVEAAGEKKVVHAGEKRFSASALIIATGAQWQKLGIPGEEEFTGKGISYCATCDGAFFKDQAVAVVGGGDTALEDALYLGRLARKVYVIHRRDQLRAQKILQRKALEEPKIEFLLHTVVKEIRGEGVVKTLLLENLKDAEQKELAVSGAFIAVGQRPNTDLVRGVLALDDIGYIITDQDCATSVAGIFAAGDVRKKGLRQITTAVGDGALAAAAAERYIEVKT